MSEVVVNKPVTELWTHDAGFRFLRQVLVSSQKYHNISPIIPMNHDMHCILKTDEEVFYCLFKKAKRNPQLDGSVQLVPNWFWKYPVFFKEFLDKFPDLNGAGESINIDCCERAIDREWTILFVYGDGSIYKIDPKKIFNAHVEALKIYPGEGLTRTQDKTNQYKVAWGHGYKENINEATFSFPVKMLDRFY